MKRVLRVRQSYVPRSYQYLMWKKETDPVLQHILQSCFIDCYVKVMMPTSGTGPDVGIIVIIFHQQMIRHPNNHTPH